VIIPDNKNTPKSPPPHERNKIILDYNSEISTHKTKKTAFYGKWPSRSKLIPDNQARSFQMQLSQLPTFKSRTI
jgi:hypothetical protein